MKKRSTTPFLKTILVGTDFSVCAARAFSYAVSLAATQGARVHLLHVLMEPIQAFDVAGALPYLDVLSAVKREFGMPTAAYNVSGEFAMIKAAAKNGWIDEKRATLEALTSIKRAGADFIITYHALEAARWLK